MKKKFIKLNLKEQKILVNTIKTLLNGNLDEDESKSILENAHYNVRAFWKDGVIPERPDKEEYEHKKAEQIFGVKFEKNLKWFEKEKEPSGPPITFPENMVIVKEQLPECIMPFLRVEEPRKLIFPEDHSEHLDFKTEWRYYSGRIKYKDGRNVAMHRAVFRIGDIYFAHESILNLKTLEYESFAEILTLSDYEKFLASNGKIYPVGNGLHQKGDNSGEASYYYRCMGDTWFEHEWGTDMLGDELAGWDYCNLTLTDGSRLAFYNLRYPDGEYSTNNTATYYGTDGSATQLTYNQFKVAILDKWTSPHTGAIYPVKQSLSIPHLGITVIIEPIILDQEFNHEGHAVYWEGAVTCSGSKMTINPNDPAEVQMTNLTGDGHLELTGFKEKLKV